MEQSRRIMPTSEQYVVHWQSAKKDLTPDQIVKVLKSIYLDHFKPIYLIFDQFEELFIFGDREEREAFIQIVKAVVDSDVQCRFIFSIREEYLAGVTEFERLIPEFLTNRMRVEKMTSKNAIQVIEGPCKVHNIEVEEGFPETVLEKLSPESTEVELTYLQVFLDKVFRLATDKNKEKPGFTNDLLREIGDVSDLLGSFLEDQIIQLEDSETGLTILKSFVSVKGTKRQVTLEDISDFATTLGKKISEEELKNLIIRFVNLRILRGKDENERYELRHDGLAIKIYEKITLVEKELLEVRQFIDNAYSNYEKRNVYLSVEDLKYIAPYEDKLFLNQRLEKFINDSKREVQKAKRRRRNIAIAAAITLIVVLSGFSIWALNERRISNLSLIKAKANILTFHAKEMEEENPTIALRLTEEAWKLDPNENIRQTMLMIYAHPDFYNIVAKHESSIESVTFSPDGKTILTGSDDGTARLWDLEGNQLHLFKGHEDGILSVTFSPDGKTILTGSYDKTVRLWDLEGNQIQVFKGHESYITAVTFSPDGKTILTGSYDKTARLWDLEGNLLQVFEVPELYSLAFSPDGKNFATGSRDGIVRLWDLSGKELLAFKGQERILNSVTFSPDGKTILTCSEKRVTARLWDLSGKELLVLDGHSEGIFHAIFSPDGRTILTGSWDKTARLWDLSGAQLRIFKGHEELILSVAFSPDGNAILTGSYDKTARLWDLKENQFQVFKGHEEDINSVAFSPDGKSILTGSGDGTARLWDLEGNQLQVFKGHESYISSIAFSPDGKTIITGSTDETVRLLDLKGNELQIFEVPGISSLTFSPNGKTILTGSWDETARLWDLDGNQLQVFKGHGELITSVTFSPNGKTILTGSWDETARLWDLKGNELQVFEVPGMFSLTFSPDGKTILTGLWDKTARLWDLEGHELQIFKGHEDGVSSVTFSPDGKTILTGSHDKTARLWDLEGHELQIFKGHKELLESVAFDPDAKNILTGSRDNTARLWKVKPLSVFQSENNYENLSISQEIEFELINYKYVIALINEEELFDGANYYFIKAGLFQKEKKIEYLNYALHLYNKLLSKQKKAKYYTGLHNIYTILQELEPADKNINEQEKIFNELLSFTDKDELTQGAEYFYSKGLEVIVDSQKVSYYFKALLLYEKVLEKYPKAEVKGDAFACYNNVALSLLFTGQFEEALTNVKKGLDLKKEEIIYTKLALAYLFNDQFDEAESIIKDHKDAIVNEISFGEYILNKLNELEAAGITHPDFEKVRGLLEQ